MSKQQPIKVCEEAFLRCAPWTPVIFRLQQKRIVKTPGHNSRYSEAINCLEAFGVRSDIDSVCAHLTTFKYSEIAKRVFCNIRKRPQRQPWSLPAAVDLSVAVELQDPMAYQAKRLFKDFLRVFLSLCQNLIEDNQSLEQRLKGAFIDVFEGLTDSNFSLEPHWNEKPIRKESSICYALHLVHRYHIEFPEYYETMISDLAILAPKHWGMYQRGNKYSGDYTKWCIPETFSGFELDTESDTPRDWDAMQGERIAYGGRSTLLSPEKRTRVAGSSSSEEEGSSLPKLRRTERSNLTLRQSTPPDIVDETSSSSQVSSPSEGEASDYEGLDRESSNTEDDVVTRNTANMDTARAMTFSPQPSTSREEEQPSTSRQADVRDVETNDRTVSSGSTAGDIRQSSLAMDTVGVSSGSSTARDIRQSFLAMDTVGVSSGSSTARDIRQSSFVMANAGLLNEVSQTPEVSSFLDECVKAMIRQRCKNLLGNLGPTDDFTE
ncbi:uncharacterized protein LOC112577260 isoform X2 [Pomacea canaliculata]|uniref:uncharacterized protein LOC112577260 isoform X2 n=1 Tax=Pomacea canaliculata TaxID=400727 RepID=UPI000D7270C3|nr:uncharacterized protein LOC112577260 isoform X2 [Pomacea canaliculata]